MKATLEELIGFARYLQPQYPDSYHKMQALAFQELRRQLTPHAPTESPNVRTHEGQEKPCKFRRSCGLIEYECPGSSACGDYEPQGG